MKAIVIILALLVTSCATVKTEDVDAWRGAPLTELETHPVFTTMNLKKEKLSDGRIMYDYVDKSTQRTDRHCYVERRSGYRSCSGGDVLTYECHNQFFVRGKVVEQYRPTGSCATDCSLRPSSNPCKD